MNTELKNKDKDLYISATSTFCRNCIFADYDKNVQVGCKANRLDKFKKANISIIEVNDEHEEEEKTSFIIEEKICVYYRHKHLKDMLYKEQSYEDILKSVQSKLIIPYHAILFSRPKDTLYDIEARLSELENQKIKPTIVTIVDRSHKIENMSGKIMTTCQNNFNFDHWRVQTIQDVDEIDTDAIDLVFDSTKELNYMFYIVFESSHVIPATLSEEMHKSIHDDMKAFVVLLPNSNNIGRGALKIAHKKHAGNSFTILLEDKIRHYDDSPQLIKKVEDICPSLQVS